jgi:tricorn protease
MKGLILSAALVIGTGTAIAQPTTPLLLQRPTLSRQQIVFAHAGDLWSVPRQGGAASRLTAGTGVETNPVFSPDGTTIAFTGEYDGNVDVFVVGAGGGVPRRLTWHPAADTVLGWTPDGSRVLFTSTRTAASRYAELFTIGRDGGLPQRLPLPMGAEGAYSPDGSRVAYVPLQRAFTTWKRYRGGRATAVWLATLQTSRIEKVPRDTSNDFNPMWVGDTVYFLSDRDGGVTLHSYDTRSKKVVRLFENDGLDLKSASAGPGAIVYEQFGSLGLYDLETGRRSRVPVTVPGDYPEVRERLLRVGSALTNGRISPTGARAVFEAHGEILTVPAEKGDPRNLSNTPGAMDRDPAWSPDGTSIAWFSDQGGEYALHVRAQSGAGEPTRIPLSDKPSIYFSPRWSPDSKRIAFTDSHQTLWYVDLAAKKPVRVDDDRFWSRTGDVFQAAWSPDSKWIAYAKRLPNYLGAVFLHSIEQGTSVQVTDGMSDARAPVFDAGGKYLYFTASTDTGASLQPDIHSFSRPSSRSVYLVVLSKDDPSPFAPESDEEKPGEEKSGEEKSAGEVKPDPARESASPLAGQGAVAPATAKSPTGGQGGPPTSGGARPAKPVTVEVDVDGILQRVLAVPMPARRYASLQAGKAGVLFALEAPAPPVGQQPPPQQAPGLTVHRYDLKARKADVAASGVTNFELSANGEKMLYRQGERWFITALKPMPAPGAPPSPPPSGPPTTGALATDNIEVRVDPPAEWRQMFREAWRIQREFFYDPNLHGLDLAAAEKKYAPVLESVASRSDLNYLFAEMLGEITVSHLGVGGGSMPEPRRVETGLLGADYTVENGRYRFARVYNGENWNPTLVAPLTQPGVNVAAGEYLLAVNGRPLTGADSVYRFFEGTVGKSVALRVGPGPTEAGSREVTVVPVASEQALRNYAWIEDNRRLVDKATGGRVAYVYMPDTATGGFTFFNRYFYAQVGKEAVIVDERFNGGGNLATDIVEILGRPLMSMVATRDGEDEAQPQGAVFGPKAMLINEMAGSGGDALPWYFRKARLGPLIGKRTWGGLVGRAAGVPLMDGGFVGAPSSAVWDPATSQWIAENVGVSPDVEVEQDPELVRQGKDPQLEKAIEYVMGALAKRPASAPKRPAYPVYRR